MWERSVGPFVQHDWPSGTQLSAAKLEDYLIKGHPVLWLDHGGRPKNNTYPQDPYRSDTGHAKVIIGYDTNATADTSDDLVLVNDPWPEYNHRGILPVNTTKGPGGTFDPYWQPLNDVNLNDVADIYLVDTWADIPEFGSLLLPISATLLIAVVLVRRNRPLKSQPSRLEN